jgi:hypothetical protein
MNMSPEARAAILELKRIQSAQRGWNLAKSPGTAATVRVNAYASLRSFLTTPDRYIALGITEAEFVAMGVNIRQLNAWDGQDAGDPYAFYSGIEIVWSDLLCDLERSPLPTVRPQLSAGVEYRYSRLREQS